MQSLKVLIVADPAVTGGVILSLSLPPNPPTGAWTIPLLPAIPAIVTDPVTVVQRPPAPPLPGRWKTFTDPTFGSTILQLTGPEDGANCGVQYGMWPVFNCDDTRMLVVADGHGWMFTWTPGDASTLVRSELPESMQLTDAVWSHTDPDVIFHRAGQGISAYNVATGVDTVLVDWSVPFADAPFSYRMTVSEDDDVFAWAREKTDYTYVGWGAWRRSTGALYKEPAARFGQFAKVWIDKSGRYLWNCGYLPAGLVGEIIDLETGAVEPVTDCGPDYGPGHMVQGPGWAIGYNDYENCHFKRAWSDPHHPVAVTPPSNGWGETAEFSMLNTASDYYYVAIADQHAHTDGLYHDELVGFAADSGKVRRLCHMHAAIEWNPDGSYDYNTLPKPSVSYTGKYVAFSSPRGVAGGRCDVFVVRIP